MTLKLYRYKIFSINNIIKGSIRSRSIKGYFTHVCMLAQPLSRVQLFVTSWTVAHQAPLSMEFSRQEYWVGLPFPFPGDLPNSRDQIQVSCLTGDEPPVKPPTLANDMPTSTVTI